MRGTRARRTMCKTRAERTMPTLLRRTAAQPALVRFGPSYPAESHMEIFAILVPPVSCAVRIRERAACSLC